MLKEVKIIPNSKFSHGIAIATSLIRVHSVSPHYTLPVRNSIEFCSTPSSRSLLFALRKNFVHYFGATSAFHFVSAYANFNKKKAAD